MNCRLVVLALLASSPVASLLACGGSSLDSLSGNPGNVTTSSETPSGTQAPSARTSAGDGGNGAGATAGAAPSGSAPFAIPAGSYSTGQVGGIPNASVPYIAYSAGGWTTLTPQYIDSASTNNVSLGTYAGRVAYEFSMPGGYQGPWWGPEESRSEFLYGPPATSNDSPLGPGFYGPGQTVTFAYSFYVPQGFPTDMAWATLFQTHPSGPTWQGNQLSVNVNGGTLAFGDFNSSQHKIALSDLMGQWVNVTAKAYFSQGDDGQIQWTVQIGSQSPMSWTTNGATIGPDSVGTYIKQGLYRQYDYGGYASVYETPVMLYAG